MAADPLRFRPLIESLDARIVPATGVLARPVTTAQLAIATASFDQTTGTLTVNGTDRADNISLTESHGSVVVNGVGLLFGNPYAQTPGYRTNELAAAVVKSVVINGHGGDDVLSVRELRGTFDQWSSNTKSNQAVPRGVTLNGGIGNDTLYGGEANATLNGDTDADTIDGGSGNETILGGSGWDWVRKAGTGDKLSQVEAGDISEAVFTAKVSALRAAGYDLGTARTAIEVVTGGFRVRYTAGDLYAGAGSGVRVVSGAIAQEYDRRGGATALGLPVTDELPSSVGRVSHFQRGSIYWNSYTGATRFELRTAFSGLDHLYAKLPVQPATTLRAIMASQGHVGKMELKPIVDQIVGPSYDSRTRDLLIEVRRFAGSMNMLDHVRPMLSRLIDEPSYPGKLELYLASRQDDATEARSRVSTRIDPSGTGQAKTADGTRARAGDAVPAFPTYRAVYDSTFGAAPNPSFHADKAVGYRDFSATAVFNSVSPHGVSVADVNQGGVGDCYLLAPLAALAARNPAHVRSLLHDNGDNTVSVRFWDGVGNAWTYVTVSKDLPVTGNGGLAYARGHVLWAPLIEKAYAAINPNRFSVSRDGRVSTPIGNLSLLDYGSAGAGSYESLTKLPVAGFTTDFGGIPLMPTQALTGVNSGGLAMHVRSSDGPNPWVSLGQVVANVFTGGLFGATTEIMSAVAVAQWPGVLEQAGQKFNEGKIVTLSTSWNGSPDPSLYTEHVYSVMGYDAARKVFTLRNPHGNNSHIPQVGGGVLSRQVESGTFSVTLDYVAKNFRLATWGG